MFNGNLIARLIKEQRKQVGDMVAYVFGGNSHISKTYFKNRTSIDSKYLEKLSAFFQVPIQDFFLTDEEFEDRESQTNVHHILYCQYQFKPRCSDGCDWKPEEDDWPTSIWNNLVAQPIWTSYSQFS